MSIFYDLICVIGAGYFAHNHAVLLHKINMHLLPYLLLTDDLAGRSAPSTVLLLLLISSARIPGDVTRTECIPA